MSWVTQLASWRSQNPSGSACVLPHSQGHRTACLSSSCRESSAPQTSGLAPSTHLQPGLAELSQSHERQSESLAFAGWERQTPGTSSLRHQAQAPPGQKMLAEAPGRSEPGKQISFRGPNW